jgi:Fic family protein
MTGFQEFLSGIDRLKGELDALRPLDREQEDRVLQKFRLWWTFHSNAIEGNVLTQGETEMFLMEGLTAKGKPLKDHLDLRGHSNAINYLLEFIRNNEVLTEAAIRKLHEILLVEPYQVPAITLDGKPAMKTVALGQYKTQANHVRTPTGEIHYYATPEETSAKMDDLMRWYREEETNGVMHPVEIAARFHHRFTDIHPFDDGNGRMSRLLMNLILMQKQFPPVVIRIGERDLYLASLRRADADEYEDFLGFIAEHVVQSLDLYLRAAKGEEIQEPTDLEKEIALLKMELEPIEEPQRLTQPIQAQVFSTSVRPLFAEIAKLLLPLCDLFSENHVIAGVEYGSDQSQTGIGGQETLSSLPSYSPPAQCWTGLNTIRALNLTFNLKGFKKARFNTFDLSGTLSLRFEQLKYSVVVPSVSPAFTIQHFYQESLSKDQISEIAQKLTRSFVDAIRQHTVDRFQN